MSITRTVALSFVVVAAIACTTGGIADVPTGLPHAAARPSCGPADGPAVEILLASEPLGPSAPTSPYVRIYIWQSRDQLTQRLWRMSGDDPGGSASYHTSASDFSTATDGVVRVSAVDADETVRGWVDLRFENGRQIRGGFRAVWIPAAPLCG